MIELSNAVRSPHLARFAMGRGGINTPAHISILAVLAVYFMVWPVWRMG